MIVIVIVCARLSMPFQLKWGSITIYKLTASASIESLNETHDLKMVFAKRIDANITNGNEQFIQLFAVHLTNADVGANEIY